MKELQNKLSVISIAAFGLFPILPSEKRGVLVILIGLVSLILLLYNRKFKLNRLLLINSSLYITYVLSLVYSIDTTHTFKRFETALSIILFPLFFTIFSSSNKIVFLKEAQFFLYKLFIISATSFSLIIFLYVRSLGYFNGSKNYEYCISQLSSKLPLLNDHPIYMSIILSLAILFLIDLVKKCSGKKAKTAFYILVMVFLTSTLLFLSRKGVIVAFIISLTALLTSYFKTKKSILVISLSASVIVILTVFVASNQKRFKELFKQETYITKNETNSTNNRIQIYKCALTLIKNKPLIGYGVGKDRIALYSCYKENLYYLYENKYNIHNQYLSIATKVGLVGLSIFLIFLFYNLKIAVKSKDIMFLCIILFYSFTFLFENVLERQNGVILFSFLINYFAYKQEKNKETLTKELIEK